MKYFRNTELAKRYKVSEKTVRNWIEATKQGKLDMQLFIESGKTYIADTAKNLTLAEQLVAKGQKYKNTRGYKVITPSPEFYELFNTRQIFEIITSINIHREIPLQYNYLGSGADDWDKYTQRLEHEHAPNMLNSNRLLLTTNFDSLDRLVGEHRKVNLIDLGTGNGAAAKDLVGHFIAQDRLNRYVGIDISPSMLDIVERNMHAWFGDKARFEFHQLDIAHEEFGEFLASDYFSKDSSSGVPINIVLFFGGTIANFDVPGDILRIINRSMHAEDLFMLGLKLDTPNSRQYFDLDQDPTKSRKIATSQRHVLDLLNIDESLYEVEQIFDEGKWARFIGGRFKVDISITFKLNEGEHVVHLHKGERLLALRYRHYNALDVLKLLQQNGFEPLQSSKTRDREYLLTISEPKIA